MSGKASRDKGESGGCLYCCGCPPSDDLNDLNDGDYEWCEHADRPYHAGCIERATVYQMETGGWA